MLSVSQNLTEQVHAAEHKVHSASSPVRYLISSMLAGAYVGIAVVLMLATAGPFKESSVYSAPERLVSGAVFGIALTLVVFAGAELCTSAMMILTQGCLSRSIKVRQAIGVLLFNVFGNLLGSMLFSWLVVESGALGANGGYAAQMLKDMLTAKAAEPSVELFFRGVLCNILVCLAIWCCGRLKSEAGKAIIIFWCVFAFISSGFEHVVANMTTFSLGLFSGGDLTTWSDFGRNVLFVGLGNLVGGALFIGVAYYVVGRPVAAEVPEDPHSTSGPSSDALSVVIAATRAPAPAEPAQAAPSSGAANGSASPAGPLVAAIITDDAATSC